MSHRISPRGWIRFLFENSVFLLAGAAIALIWANADMDQYSSFVHSSLFSGLLAETSLFNLVNDVFMAFFFAIAAKEVWESLLPGGALSKWSTAGAPLVATLGGIIAPAAVYLTLCVATGESEQLARGWAIPCATDIAFSYVVARAVFGRSHPAIAFLLLLAIADDAVGLVIIAVAYPREAIAPEWLLACAAAIALGLFMRRIGVRNFWLYLAGPGALSWLSFELAGLHAALGLVPIIPTMPHASRDPGLFTEEKKRDTLSEFARWWKHPVELILGLFGLVNAGVLVGTAALPTWIVGASLIVGKPIGIITFVVVGGWLFRTDLPEGMKRRELVVVGIIAGIGFTVSLFVSNAAFPEGSVRDAAKLGSLLSVASAGIGICIARVLRISQRSE